MLFIVLTDICFCLLICSKTVTAATLKQGWASVVIQRHWRGYRMRQVYQVVRLASVTIQAFTRGWMARKRYKKVCNCSLINESLNNKKIVNVTTRFILHCVCVNPQMMKEQKALVLQKYARAWMARRRFQTMRRLVLNVQLSYRVQQLRKKIEEQVTMLPNVLQLWL